MSSLKMSHCYLAFRTNVLLNLCCPGHLSYYSPNESEPLGKNSSLNRDSNPHSSIGGRLGKQTCKPLHHASPQSPYAWRQKLWHTPEGLYLCWCTLEMNRLETQQSTAPGCSRQLEPIQKFYVAETDTEVLCGWNWYRSLVWLELIQKFYVAETDTEVLCGWNWYRSLVWLELIQKFYVAETDTEVLCGWNWYKSLVWLELIQKSCVTGTGLWLVKVLMQVALF